MVRRGEPLSSIGRGQSLSGRVAHSTVAGSPRVAGPPPTQPTGSRLSSEWSLDLGDRPGKPGELAGRGNRDDRAALGAGFEPGPGAVESLLS